MEVIKVSKTDGTIINTKNPFMDNTNRVTGNNGTADINFDRILNEKRENYNPYQNQNKEKSENPNDDKNNEDQRIIHPFLGHNFDGRF